ncbi:MAG: efflux RND transporter periplasmic adaptor subunit [Planctomycetota bacterium]|jgi:RND family efflux transporter MFP subunit
MSGKGIVALSLAVLLSGCSQPPPEPDVIRPVRAVRAGDVSTLDGRWFPGKAQATQEVNLSFRVSGPLVEFPVIVGDRVTQDQVLARIDPRDFQVELRNAEAQLAEAKAVRDLREDEYARAQTAHQRGGISDIELSRQLAERDRSRATVASNEAAVEAAQDALEYTNLKAPFDGIVVATFVENFEDVLAKQQIVRVLDDSRIEMIIDVPEQLISLAPYVEVVTCTFDALPGLEVPAEIKEIGTEASQTTRTYPITLIMDQPADAKIFPGMTGQARGRARPPGADATEGLEVPVSAVASADGRTGHVWIIDDASGTVSQRPITVVELTPAGIRVQGVEPGEWVATAGAHYLTEGQQVRILSDEASEASEETPS